MTIAKQILQKREDTTTLCLRKLLKGNILGVNGDTISMEREKREST